MKTLRLIGLGVLALGAVLMSMAMVYWGIQDRRVDDEAAEIIREIRETARDVDVSPTLPAMESNAGTAESSRSSGHATEPSDVPAWEDLFAEWDRLATSDPLWPALRDTYFWRLKLRDWPRDDVEQAIALHEEMVPFLDELRRAALWDDSIPNNLVSPRGAWGVVPPVVDLSNSLFLDILMAGSQNDLERVVSTVNAGMTLADRVAESSSNDFGAQRKYFRITLNMAEAVEQSLEPGQLHRGQTLMLVKILDRPIQWDPVYHAFVLTETAGFESRLEQRRRHMSFMGLVDALVEGRTMRDKLGEAAEWGSDVTIGREIGRFSREHDLTTLRELQELETVPYHLLETVSQSDPKNTTVRYARNRMDYAAYVGTRLALARAGLLVELYQRETGRVAATLAEVEARYEMKLGRDGFTDKPFVYKPKADGFLLYALGRSGHDHEGAHEGPRFNHSVESRNIVWRGPLYYFDRDPTAATDGEWAEMGFYPIR